MDLHLNLPPHPLLLPNGSPPCPSPPTTLNKSFQHHIALHLPHPFLQIRHNQHNPSSADPIPPPPAPRPVLLAREHGIYEGGRGDCVGADPRDVGGRSCLGWDREEPGENYGYAGG